MQHVHTPTPTRSDAARSLAATTLVPRAATRTLLSAAAALLLAGAAVVAAPAAFAHDALVESTPASGTTVKTAPDEATLRFSGALQTIGKSTVVELTDEAGTELDAEASINRDTLTVDFGQDLPDGGYTLVWRVVSSDGHPIEGTPSNGEAIEFTVEAGSTTESAAASAASENPTASSGAASAPAASSGAATPSAAESGTPDASASTAPAETEATGLGGLPAPVVWIVLGVAVVAAAGVVLAKARRQTK